ncbi:MAG: SWIM zinc finger family protein [Armatimonadota bacterium]
MTGRQLELLQIRRWVGETTFERGLDYADRGKVADPRRAGDVLTADVEGSIPRGEDEPARYKVRVDLEPPVPRSGCTCPVRQPFCKHAAALLIMWQRAPDAFALADPDADSATRPAVPPRRGPSKTAERQRARLQELDPVGQMIEDLAIAGIRASGAQCAEAIPDMLARARRRRQLRLAALLEELHGAATAREAAEDHDRWVDVLLDLWHTLEATRHYVQGTPVDERALESLVGRVPREAGLARRYQVGLLELAYEVVSGPLGTRRDVSYLMDLNSGELFVERAAVPARRAGSEELKRSYDAPLLATEMGVYPGYAPPRVALIAVEGAALSFEQAASQALEFAETSLSDIHERLVELIRDPLAPRETFALLALDGVPERDGALHLLDAEGRCTPVVDSPPPHPPTLADFEEYALDRLPPAVFARFFARDATMCAAPLSIVEAAGVVRLGATPQSV